MGDLEKIIAILPPIEFVQSFLKENPMELAIIEQFYDVVNRFVANQLLDENLLYDTYTMMDAVKDHLWEILNTGHFSQVSRMHRQLITLASLAKSVLLLIKGHCKQIDANQAGEKCMWELDNGLLLGCPLEHPIYSNILSDILSILQKTKATTSNDAMHQTVIRNVNNEPRSANELCDIDVLERPSIQQFQVNYFGKSKPVILTDCINQWPAMTKWNQINYLLDACRSRVVPIEIGKNYTHENWSQDLVKFEDFFRRQFLDDSPYADDKRIEYLAQHNLFNQIPALQKDITTPEYCCTTNQNASDEIDVDIKAWLGPEGTISPMHIDDKHNLLCQVFGAKRIILAAPSDSINLYPFDGDMLKNTSQIDAEHPDVGRFPLLQHVKFYQLTLHKGEMLYIPSKWWHFVRSLSKSFSVSFWWE